MLFFFQISALKILAVATGYACVFCLDLWKNNCHYNLTYYPDRAPGQKRQLQSTGRSRISTTLYLPDSTMFNSIQFITPLVLDCTQKADFAVTILHVLLLVFGPFVENDYSRFQIYSLSPALTFSNTCTTEPKSSK